MNHPLRVLFIGGSGIISSASTTEALKQGIELYHLNRGKSNSIRPIPSEVHQIIADIRDENQVSQAIANLNFDVVVDWISFLPEQLDQSLRLLKGKTKQYLFISSASAYQTPPQKLPVNERTPLDNPFWQYSRDKVACEQLLIEKSQSLGMNYTIVRPSHTYDKTTIPIPGGYTAVNRMKQGKPVVVPGDGTSIWTLTNHRDFAVGLVGLLGNPHAMNEDFHITSDEWLSWNQIFDMLASAFSVDIHKIHIPSEVIPRYDSKIGDSLIGDKMHSMIFDNSKIKAAVPQFCCMIPFVEGIKEIAAWYESDLLHQVIDQQQDAMWDQLISDFIH